MKEVKLTAQAMGIKIHQYLEVALGPLSGDLFTTYLDPIGSGPGPKVGSQSKESQN